VFTLEVLQVGGDHHSLWGAGRAPCDSTVRDRHGSTPFSRFARPRGLRWCDQTTRPHHARQPPNSPEEASAFENQLEYNHFWTRL